MTRCLPTLSPPSSGSWRSCSGSSSRALGRQRCTPQPHRRRRMLRRGAANRISKLPTVVDLVIYDFLSVGWNLHYELHGLAVDFLKRIGILDDVPARPAVEMLHDAHLDGRGLVIPHLYLKRFINPSPIEVGPVFRPAALPGHVKCAAGIQAYSFVLWRVVDVVLAGELELPIVITAVE